MSIDELRNPRLKRYRLILSEIEGKKVLDLGSSEGRLHQFLVKSLRTKPIGIDIVKGPNTDVIADLDKKIPFSPSSIDTIVAGEVIEHLKEPYHFLRECHRVLKPGGKLILTTPNARGLQFILGYDYSFHFYCWTMPFFKRLITSSGFRIEKTALVNSSFLSAYPVFMLPCELLPAIKPLMFASCRKTAK